MKKNNDDDEKFYRFVAKAWFSFPLCAMGWGIMRLWMFILAAIHMLLFKIVVSIPLCILLISIAVLLYEIWRGDFTDNY